MLGWRLKWIYTNTHRRPISAGALPLGDNSIKMDHLSAASYLRSLQPSKSVRAIYCPD